MSTRRTVVALLAMALVAGAAFAAHADVGPLQSPGITGTVTNSSGAPLANICVGVWDKYGYFYDGGATTDNKGNYSVSVSQGDYKVQFLDCSAQAQYVSQWYSAKSDFDSADVVTVTTLQKTS